MPEEAADHSNYCDHGSRNVRSLGLIVGGVANESDQRNQCNSRENHGSAVDHQGAEPFPQIVTLCAEDEPFIAKKRYGDADQIGCKTGGDIGVYRHDL